jgi:hypothetical protein
MNFKLNNNFSIAERIFDEIAIWQNTKKPKISLQSLIGKIEKILDTIEKRGFDKNNK